MVEVVVDVQAAMVVIVEEVMAIELVVLMVEQAMAILVKPLVHFSFLS